MRCLSWDFIVVVLLLVRIRYVDHVLQVCKLAVRGASIPKSPPLGLNGPLSVNILVPAFHGVIVLVPNDEIVDNAWVTFPEDLYAIETCSRVNKYDPKYLYGLHITHQASEGKQYL